MSESEHSSFTSDGSSEDCFEETRSPSVSPPKVTRQRPSRQRTVPARLREVETTVDALEEIQLDMSTPVVVKCSQTSKCHNTKLKDLSREDGEPLSKKDLTKGSNLILEMRGKSYAVQFMYKGKGKVQKGSRENDSKKTERKRQLEVEEDVGQLRDTTNVPEVLARAKAAKVAKNKPQPPAKKTKMDSDAMDTGEKQKSKSPNTQRDMDDNTLTILDNGDKDLIVDLARRVEKLEKTLISFLEVLKTREVTSKSTEGIVMCSVKKEDDECTVGGVNVLRLPSRDAYSFALQLLDILFTKEELQSSLLFKSKKSEKPGLDQSRVEKMMRLIERRYGNEWDIKTLTAKVNQKCRDKK